MPPLQGLPLPFLSQHHHNQHHHHNHQSLSSSTAPTWIPPIRLQPPPLPPVSTSALSPARAPSPPPQQQQPPPPEGRIIFTRQLWQRSMPNEPIEVPLSKHNPALASELSHHADARASRRTSSSVSSRSLRHPSSPNTDSRAPLTPEESPPSRPSKKRTISSVAGDGDDDDDDHKSYRSADTSPAHTRTSSDDSTAQVCICQPDPKIPRPRNAFILYRQHHQAKVIAQHPGLANPEISKIIGEQWRNQPAEVKNEWKGLAEEEKLRHQQQYPTYRYQPKRNTRRNSLTDSPGSAGSEKTRCHKCGGRTILAASYPAGSRSATSDPSPSAYSVQTQSSTTTPLSRTLPVLRDLSLQSPIAGRQMGRPYPNSEMSPRRGGHIDERDILGPLSPDSKRRRYNSDQSTPIYRATAPRYGAAPAGTAVGPGTPYPFVQAPHPHPYPPAQAAAAAHIKRDSLPGLRMLSPPGPMAPPPRPGMGYQQHRLSQGHPAPDRSLTLPPLQTGSSGGTSSASKPADGRTTEEIIMGLPLSDKLEVLRRIAPPAPLNKAYARGPLIAIEGDSEEAVHQLARWLCDTLSKEEDMTMKLVDPPDVKAKGNREYAMAEYHVLAAEWLRKSNDITASLSYTLPTPPLTGRSLSSSTSCVPPAAVRENEENQEGSNTGLRSSDRQEDQEMRTRSDSTLETDKDGQDKGQVEATTISDTVMDEDKPPTPSTSTNTVKPVLILPTFSLHATNIYACRIPLNDVYSPKEHWQWSATLWRGIIGPDLTIYVRDAPAGDTGRPVDQSEVERLFVVKRTKAEGSDGMEIEGATLRRVGFEVSEWVRAHGASKKIE